MNITILHNNYDKPHENRLFRIVEIPCALELDRSHGRVETGGRRDADGLLGDCYTACCIMHFFAFTVFILILYSIGSDSSEMTLLFHCVF